MYRHVQFGGGGGEEKCAINVFVYVFHYHGSLSNVHVRLAAKDGRASVGKPRLARSTTRSYGRMLRSR